MKNLLVSLAFTLFIFGCQPKYEKSQLDKIASLNEMVSDASSTFESIDSNLALNEAVVFQQNILYLKSSMQDTLDNATLRLIKKYYGLRKGFLFLNTNYQITKEELAISKQQLQDLNHDLENKLLKKKQLDDYIELEMNNIIKVIEVSDKMNTSSKTISPIFNRLNPTIDSLIINSKAKLKQE